MSALAGLLQGNDHLLVRCWSAVAARGLSATAEEVAAEMWRQGTSVPASHVAERIAVLRGFGQLPSPVAVCRTTRDDGHQSLFPHADAVVGERSLSLLKDELFIGPVFRRQVCDACRATTQYEPCAGHPCVGRAVDEARGRRESGR